MIVAIGGADQREIILIGNDEDDAAVGVLEHVGAVVLVELAHHDVRALHQPHLGARVDAGAGAQHVLDPGPAGIDQHAGADGLALLADGVFGRDLPDAVDLPDLDRAGAGADIGAAIGGIAGVQRDEARVVDKAVGIFKALDVAAGNQRVADHVVGEIDRARRRQQVSPADMVVKKEAEPEQPGRTQARMVRQHESKRANDVGRDLPEDFALDQRLAHQAELVIFEIAQTAMHELGRPGRRPARQIIHFTEENGISTARRIARDAAAIDTPSDDREVENPIQRTLPRRVAFTSAISLSILIRSQAKAKAKRKWNWRGRFPGNASL